MEDLNNSTAEKSGNRCGHNPASPRFFSPSGNPHTARHKNRPKIIIRIVGAVRDYFSNPKTLPSLNAANGSERQQRSERREACCAIMGVMAHYLDLVTLRVGIPQPDGSMAGIPMESKDLPDGGRVVGLAELAGLSLSRAEEAMHDLKAAGIVTVHPIAEKIDETTYKGYAAIRTISRNLFEALGLGPWLAHERRKATERRRDRAEKSRRKEQAKILLAMGAQRGHAKPMSAEELRSASAATGGLVSVGQIALAAMKEALSGKPAPAPAPANNTS